jgi:hypothetical protein
MTTPSDPEPGQPPREGVDLGKSDPAGDAPFDPYRFGKPEHPIPAEYAPPGYTGPVAPPPTPYAAPTNPYGAPPPQPQNPFSNPPGTPYAGGPPPPQQPQQPPYQYPPPQYGYGSPAPPPYSGYAQPRTGNGKAIAALVLGICSIVFCWLSFFDAVFVILALIFGLIALSETKKGRSGGRGLAIAGLICTVVGALLATIISVKVVQAIDKCGGLDRSGNSSFNQCIRDNL